MEHFGDIFGTLAVLGLAALAAVWFFVPFAIFGTKSRIDDLIEELEQTNKQLAEIKAILKHEQSDEDIPSIRATR
ncbi:MAG: hypothetical protein LOY58_00485 [Gammaproteobacteria bacterium]|jgi:hypothetical protein|nr:hypothetical protein [Gammaproteobacteria bacterium]